MPAKLTAKLPAEGTSNAKNYGQEKETVDTKRLVGVVDGKIETVCDARFYMGRSSNASVVYCALWVHASPQWFSGRGQAGGYGYHKMSAALQDAINSAGIELYGPVFPGDHEHSDPHGKRAHIGGVGDSAMDEALRAIGRAVRPDVTQWEIV